MILARQQAQEYVMSCGRPQTTTCIGSATNAPMFVLSEPVHRTSPYHLVANLRIINQHLNDTDVDSTVCSDHTEPKIVLGLSDEAWNKSTASPSLTASH